MLCLRCLFCIFFCLLVSQMFSYHLHVINPAKNDLASINPNNLNMATTYYEWSTMVSCGYLLFCVCILNETVTNRLVMFDVFSTARSRVPALVISPGCPSMYCVCLTGHDWQHRQLLTSFETPAHTNNPTNSHFFAHTLTFKQEESADPLHSTNNTPWPFRWTGRYCVILCAI